MGNEFTDEQQRCIKWTMQVPYSNNHRCVSKTFLFQSRDCKLIYYTGHSGTACSHLTFNSNGELQRPATVTINVTCNSNSTLDRRNTSITRADQEIWNYGNYLTDCRLTFELIFQVGCTSANDDKSVQTPSYIDNCFLMDDVSQDFSKMFIEGPCHDMEFICEDQNIKAHKSVLCCRSDVFASMLQNDMVEGKTGQVNIQDMDAVLFRQFLGCLYTGILPPLTVEIAVHFYEAGDKYNISSLKKQCADFLVDNLLLENAYHILVLADRHNDPDLKKNVIDFMIKEQMPYTGEKWTDFCKENPILANEILNLFCQHLRPK